MIKWTNKERRNKNDYIKLLKIFFLFKIQIYFQKKKFPYYNPQN